MQNANFEGKYFCVAFVKPILVEGWSSPIAWTDAWQENDASSWCRIQT